MITRVLGDCHWLISNSANTTCVHHMRNALCSSPKCSDDWGQRAPGQTGWATVASGAAAHFMDALDINPNMVAKLLQKISLHKPCPAFLRFWHFLVILSLSGISQQVLNVGGLNMGA